MKQLLIIIISIFVITEVNSQYYAFGAFKFGNITAKNDANEKISTITEFEFSPGIGYYINDRWDIGLELGISRTVNKFDDETVNLKTTEWSFSPFTCCVIIQAGKFALSGRSSLFLVSDFKNKFYTTGIKIVPFLEYSLNEKISLLTDLNFLGVGYFYSKYLDQKTSALYIGADSDNIITLGDIRVGFIYNF